MFKNVYCFNKYCFFFTQICTFFSQLDMSPLLTAPHIYFHDFCITRNFKLYFTSQFPKTYWLYSIQLSCVLLVVHGKRNQRQQNLYGIEFLLAESLLLLIVRERFGPPRCLKLLQNVKKYDFKPSILLFKVCRLNIFEMEQIYNSIEYFMQI